MIEKMTDSVKDKQIHRGDSTFKQQKTINDYGKSFGSGILLLNAKFELNN